MHLVTLGMRPPRTALAEGEQVPDVGFPHYRGRQDAALPK